MGVTLRGISLPTRGSKNTPGCLMQQKPEITLVMWAWRFQHWPLYQYLFVSFFPIIIYLVFAQQNRSRLLYAAEI